MENKDYRFFIETDMFNELAKNISEVPQIKKFIKDDKADVFTDLDANELFEIMCDIKEPTNIDGKRKAFIRDFYALVQKESGPKPAKDFFNKAAENPLYYHLLEPNSIFFTKKSTDVRVDLMEAYGIWMIGPNDLTDTLLDIYSEDIDPHNRYFGEKGDGWTTIRNQIGYIPSSCLVLIDNFITSKDKLTNNFYGLSNIKSIIDNFVSRKRKINYSILIVAQNEPHDLILHEILISWIKKVKEKHKNLSIQFLISRNTPEHDRWLFFNYDYIYSGKGFRIFKPNSNEIIKDNRYNVKTYHITGPKYISENYKGGFSSKRKALNILQYVQTLYDETLQGKRTDSVIIGDNNISINLSK